jgi:vacuolar-type H+-ATPase subunit I/STV1
MKTILLKTVVLSLCVFSACIIKAQGQDVPQLETLHKSIYVLWHDAYPNKNYELIKSTLPELETSVNDLSKAKLPDMMHNRQSIWDSEIKGLRDNLAGLKKSVAEDNKETMLTYTESIHSSFEKLVRVLRPKLAELDSFHEDLYQLYHKHMPANDISAIKALIPSMKDKAAELKQAKLTRGLAEKQAAFEQKVSELQNALVELEKTANKGNIKKVNAAGEKVHSAYEQIDALLQ